MAPVPRAWGQLRVSGSFLPLTCPWGLSGVVVPGLDSEKASMKEEVPTIVRPTAASQPLSLARDENLNTRKPLSHLFMPCYSRGGAEVMIILSAS